MPESLSSTPDLEYAAKLRIGGAEADSSDPRLNNQYLKYKIDPSKFDHDGVNPLTPGTRSQLDHVVNKIHQLHDTAPGIKNLTEEQRTVLQNGYFVAGVNESGQPGKSEMNFVTAEQLRAMLARAVGEAVLVAYEGQLAALTEDSGLDADTVPREQVLRSTVVHVEPLIKSGPGQESRVLSTVSNVTESAADAERQSLGQQVPVFAEKAPSVELDEEFEPSGWVAFQGGTDFELRSDGQVESSAKVIQPDEEHIVTDPEQEAAPRSLMDAMRSPDSLVSALRDPELDPDVKRGLRSIVGEWNKLQMSVVAEEVWQEMVLPELRKLDENLPEMHRRTKSAVEQLQTLETGLTRLANAAEYGDYEEMGNIGRRHQFIPTFESAIHDVVPVFAGDLLGNAARRLDTGLIESDERVHKLRRSDISNISVEGAAQLLSELDITEGATPEEIMEQIRAKDTAGTMKKYRSRKDALEAVITFGRVAGNNELQNTFTGVGRTLLEEMQQLFRNGSRLTSSDVAMLKAHLHNRLAKPLEELSRSLRLADIYKSEIKR